MRVLVCAPEKWFIAGTRLFGERWALQCTVYSVFYINFVRDIMSLIFVSRYRLQLTCSVYHCVREQDKRTLIVLAGAVVCPGKSLGEGWNLLEGYSRFSQIWSHNYYYCLMKTYIRTCIFRIYFCLAFTIDFGIFHLWLRYLFSCLRARRIKSNAPLRFLG